MGQKNYDDAFKERIVKLHLEEGRSITALIKEIYHGEGCKMGYSMVQNSLEKQDTKLSLLTVHKYMRELGLKSISFRKKKPSYVKGQPHKVFPNLLDRDFTASNKNLKWCTDFTYIHLANGKTRMLRI